MKKQRYIKGKRIGTEEEFMETYLNEEPIWWWEKCVCFEVYNQWKLLVFQIGINNVIIHKADKIRA